eukprot:TRINITY_DN254818_c0_g3_i1.p1 TRINITY_DN254818_c0_g3~~TRINITY_DN254818_c0_g3_i1.p1  ORF type:complete len:200 (-),score=10.28 TRINITY_DN254818_c0_g3_i1:379-978(-)
MSERPVVINKIMGKLQTDLVQKLLDPGPYVRIQNKSPLTFEISHDDNLIKIPVLPWFRSMCPLIAVDCDGADLNREVLKQIKSLSTENGTIFRYNMSEMDLEGTFNLNIPTETVGYCPLVVEKRGMHPFGSKVNRFILKTINLSTCFLILVCVSQWVLSLKVDSDDYKWELVRLVVSDFVFIEFLEFILFKVILFSIFG